MIEQLRFPLEVMLVCVHWYAAYALSLRNLEELMAKRGVLVDHAAVHRWAMGLLPALVGGRLGYLYRAVDKLGQMVDFLLTAHRDVVAARRFFERAIDLHDMPATTRSTRAAPTRRPHAA